jgi:hypothetical protein
LPVQLGFENPPRRLPLCSPPCRSSCEKAISELELTTSVVVMLSKIVAFATATNDEVYWKLLRLNLGDGLDSNHRPFFTGNCPDSQRNTGGIPDRKRGTGPLRVPLFSLTNTEPSSFFDQACYKTPRERSDGAA